MFGAPVVKGHSNDISVPLETLPKDSISSIAFNRQGEGESQGKLLAAGSWDSTVRLWSVNQAGHGGFGAAGLATAAGCLKEKRPVLCTDFRPTDNAVLFGGLDKTVKAWRPEWGEDARVSVASHTQPVSEVKWLDHHGGLVVR